MKVVWKILIALAIVLVVIVVGVIGIGIWAFSAMQGVARDIYGGPLKNGMVATVAIDWNHNRMGAYSDPASRSVILLIEAPRRNFGALVNSFDTHVESALSHIDSKNPFMKGAMQGGAYENVGAGKMMLIKAGNKNIPVLQYPGDQGLIVDLSLLHLDQTDMFITVMSRDSDQVNTQFKNFVETCPRLAPIVTAPEATETPEAAPAEATPAAAQ